MNPGFCITQDLGHDLLVRLTLKKLPYAFKKKKVAIPSSEDYRFHSLISLGQLVA